MLPTKIQVNLPFGSGAEAKNIFQGGGHLGFRIRTILTIFDLHFILMLPTKLLWHTLELGMSTRLCLL